MKKFKDWSIPGPALFDPDHSNLRALEAKLGEPVTQDFLSGNYRLYQLKHGHRFSTDDLLVAGYALAHAPQTRRILELGSGIGTIGILCAWRCSGSIFTTVEAQEASYALAIENVRVNGLQDRFTQILGDFRQTEIPNSSFDLVLGSPPYFPLQDGLPAEHTQKRACRFEVRGDVRDYCQVASKALAPGGQLALVFPLTPIHQWERLVQGAADSGLCILRYQKILFKEGEAALLGVFLLGRIQDYPEALRREGPLEDQPLTVRTAAGRTSLNYKYFKMTLGFPPTD